MIISRGKNLRRIAFRCLCISPAVICTLILLISKQFSVPVTVWHGHNILLIDAEAELGPVLESLGSIPHISETNTHVYINVFSGVEKVPLAQIEARLDVNDPRYDRYVSGLQRYFSAAFDADNWHVVYLKSDRTQLSLLVSLKRALGTLGIDYRLPEWRPGWFLLGPLAAFGVILLFSRGSRRIWEMIFLALPLVILATKASGLGLAAALLMIPGWQRLVAVSREMLEDFLYNRRFALDRRLFLRPAVLFGIGMAWASVIAFFHTDAGGFFIAMLATVGALFVSLASLAALRLYGVTDRYHTLFYGMPLLRGTGFDSRHSFSPLHNTYAALILIAVVFSPCLILLSRIDPDLATARPHTIRAFDELTVASLRELGQKIPENRLPDLADYVAHRAYQDSLPYRREWAYPGRDEVVTISNFKDENGKIVPRESGVFSFDTTWFDTVIADAATDGLGSMFLGQGGTVVTYGIYQHRGVARALRSIATAVLVIVPLAYTLPSLTTYCIYGMRNLPLRRKRQTA